MRTRVVGILFSNCAKEEKLAIAIARVISISPYEVAERNRKILLILVDHAVDVAPNSHVEYLARHILQHVILVKTPGCEARRQVGEEIAGEATDASCVSVGRLSNAVLEPVQSVAEPNGLRAIVIVDLIKFVEQAVRNR